MLQLIERRGLSLAKLIYYLADFFFGGGGSDEKTRRYSVSIKAQNLTQLVLGDSDLCDSEGTTKMSKCQNAKLEGN